jgi:hypothetical protein
VKRRKDLRICLILQTQRFFAQFILRGQGQILRFAQNDSEGFRMTPPTSFSAACLAPPLILRGRLDFSG